MFLRILSLLFVTALIVACGAAPPGAPTDGSTATSVLSPASPSNSTAISEPAPTTASPPAGQFTLPAPPERLSLMDGSLVIDGSSTVFPIIETSALAFRGHAPNVDIRLGVSGTGGGFKKFCAGETIISNASRPIKESEAAECAAQNISFIELPVAFDGLSVVVNPANSWAVCMTVDELRQIWEPTATGVITSWNQVRADWPAEPMRLYGAGADSGTYDYFTLAVVGEEGVSRQDYTGSEDDYLLAQDIAEDTGGLGFFGYAYYVEYADRLRLVEIDAGAGCVSPGPETIAQGSYQPLSRPIFVYVRADALERPEVRAFVDFTLANGPALVNEARYVPLPPRAYELALLRVERGVTGSVFSGGSQTGISIEQLLELEGN